jgi:hypothetical protein
VVCKQKEQQQKTRSKIQDKTKQSHRQKQNKVTDKSKLQQ